MPFYNDSLSKSLVAPFLYLQTQARQWTKFTEKPEDPVLLSFNGFNNNNYNIYMARR